MFVGMTNTDKLIQEPPLTVPEAAQALRVSTTTLRNWIAQGTVLSIRPGRCYLVPRSELNRLLTPRSGR